MNLIPGNADYASPAEVAWYVHALALEQRREIPVDVQPCGRCRVDVRGRPNLQARRLHFSLATAEREVETRIRLALADLRFRGAAATQE